MLLVVPGMVKGGSDTSDTSETSSLTVLCASQGASVFVDSLYVGLAPLTLANIPKGSHIIRINAGAPEDWYNRPIVDTISLMPGDRTTLRFSFDAAVLVSSVPAGATIRVGHDSLGTTPAMVHVSCSNTRREAHLELSGYRDTSLTLPGSPYQPVTVSLKRGVLGKIGNVLPGSGESVKSRTRLPLYITVGSGILTGAAAAYFKIKADNAQSMAALTGNPTLEPKLRQWDSISAGFLVTSQLCLGLFLFLLFSE